MFVCYVGMCVVYMWCMNNISVVCYILVWFLCVICGLCVVCAVCLVYVMLVCCVYGLCGVCVLCVSGNMNSVSSFDWGMVCV